MITDPYFYAFAVPAMVILGLSKGGFAIIGQLGVPIMALAISPVQAAGIQLPILLATDIVAVISYRRHFDKRSLMILLPAAMVGIAAGWATAAWVTEDFVRLIVGVISVAFALNYWLGGHALLAAGASVAKGSFWGAIAGFTSFVSHSGAPPFQMYMLPLRLDPRVFVGTGVIFFATMNAVKLIPYFFLGQLDRENLATAAALAPVALIATLAGVWLVRRIKQALFYRIVNFLIFAVGLKLVWDGITHLI